MTISGSPINQLYCVKDIDNYFIEGDFDADNYAFFEIKVNICVNNTDPSAPICKPFDQIQKATSGYFAYYTMDYLIDPQNFKSPGQAVGRDYYTPISIGISRKTTRYIATSIVNSDDGFLFTSKNAYIYPTYDNDFQTLLMDSKNQGYLMDFVLRMYHSENISERRYKKFQNVLAEIGGFIQILFLIFLSISYPIISKKYYEKLTNAIYNFEYENEKSINNSKSIELQKPLKLVTSSQPKLNKKLKSSTSDSHKLNVNSANFIQIIDKKNAMDSKFLKYIMKIKNRLPLKMTSWEFIKETIFPFYQKKEKIKRINKGKKAIIEKLDISYVLKKFYEIDKLKMLILNENQFHLFEYLPKPVILKNSEIDLGNSKKSGLISYETDADTIGKAKKMYFAYQNITKQNEMSVLDKKLIELLDGNIKEILKKVYYYIFFLVQIFIKIYFSLGNTSWS